MENPRSSSVRPTRSLGLADEWKRSMRAFQAERAHNSHLPTQPHFMADATGAEQQLTRPEVCQERCCNKKRNEFRERWAMGWNSVQWNDDHWYDFTLEEDVSNDNTWNDDESEADQIHNSCPDVLPTDRVPDDNLSDRSYSFALKEDLRNDKKWSDDESEASKSHNSRPGFLPTDRVPDDNLSDRSYSCPFKIPCFRNSPSGFNICKPCQNELRRIKSCASNILPVDEEGLSTSPHSELRVSGSPTSQTSPSSTTTEVRSSAQSPPRLPSTLRDALGMPQTASWWPSPAGTNTIFTPTPTKVFPTQAPEMKAAILRYRLAFRQ